MKVGGGDKEQTSSLQDLKNEVTIPAAEAAGYTMDPLRGLIGDWERGARVGMKGFSRLG